MNERLFEEDDILYAKNLYKKSFIDNKKPVINVEYKLPSIKKYREIKAANFFFIYKGEFTYCSYCLDCEDCKGSKDCKEDYFSQLECR